MTSVTCAANSARHSTPLTFQMIAPCTLNTYDLSEMMYIEGHSESCIYGNFVTMYAELFCSGRIASMETLMRRHKFSPKLRNRQRKNIDAGLQQYRTLKLLHKITKPSRSFARFVLFNDRRYNTVDFSWVKIDFVRKACETLIHQLRLIVPSLSSLIFEFPVVWLVACFIDMQLQNI